MAKAGVHSPLGWKTTDVRFSGPGRMSWPGLATAGSGVSGIPGFASFLSHRLRMARESARQRNLPRLSRQRNMLHWDYSAKNFNVEGEAAQAGEHAGVGSDARAIFAHG